MRFLPFALLLAASATAETRIADPEAFVSQVYRSITAHPRDYAPPRDIYTARLKALFLKDEQRAAGEVGCVDFDVWTNSQDPEGIRDIRVASIVSRNPKQKTVVASFVLTRPEEIHFEFRRFGKIWLLDEVSSQEAPRWTLSRLLRCKK